MKIHGMEYFKILTPSFIFHETQIFLHNAPLHITDGGTDNICTQLLSRAGVICYQLFAQGGCNSVADSQEAERREKYEIKNTNLEIFSNECVWISRFKLQINHTSVHPHTSNQ